MKAWARKHAVVSTNRRYHTVNEPTRATRSPLRRQPCSVNLLRVRRSRRRADSAS